MPSTPSPTSDDERAEPTPRPEATPFEDEPRGLTLPRVAAVTVFLLFAIMWIYVFANQGKMHPASWLEDRRFPEAAEPICKAASADIDALPSAPSAKTAGDRADVVDRATDRLVEMQGELRGVIPAGSEREKFIRQWVDDWSIYIQDRYDYADALRVDEHAEFLVTQKYDTQLSKSMDNFSQVNKMGSCQTPDDV